MTMTNSRLFRAISEFRRAGPLAAGQASGAGRRVPSVFSFQEPKLERQADNEVVFRLTDKRGQQ
jgi:hypothetical protein